MRGDALSLGLFSNVTVAQGATGEEMQGHNLAKASYEGSRRQLCSGDKPHEIRSLLNPSSFVVIGSLL